MHWAKQQIGIAGGHVANHLKHGRNQSASHARDPHEHGEPQRSLSALPNRTTSHADDHAQAKLHEATQ
jgi:hypothetical protein